MIFGISLPMEIQSPIYRVNAGEKPKCWDGRFPEFIDHIIVGPIAEKAVETPFIRRINL